MAELRDNRSFGELVSAFLTGVTKMFRQEIDLAKAEMSKKVVQGAKDAIFLIIGAVLAFAGLLTLIAAAIAALALAIPVWASALIIGILVLAIGGSFALKGISDLQKEKFVPEATIETLKEDVRWAKEQI
jgi:hypothetical protein